MMAQGWRELILDAVAKAQAGDESQLDLLARHLEMCDEAKQELRNRGYGWTGLDILETTRLVEQAGEPSNVQLVFVNMKTGINWLCPVGEMWPVIPRIGETVQYDVGDNGPRSFFGTVEDVIWSTSNMGGFSVFIKVQPTKAGFGG